MSRAFSLLCEDVSTARKFGICDDRPHQRAYLDTSDDSKWSAVVDNKSGKAVTFTALDNCIEFKTFDNKMERRCEGAITFDKTIILVEVKERNSKKAKEWAKDAEEQLRNTIKILAERIDLSQFEFRRAAICNKLRKRSKGNHMERINRFRDETGYILTVDNRIVID